MFDTPARILVFTLALVVASCASPKPDRPVSDAQPLTDPVETTAVIPPETFEEALVGPNTSALVRLPAGSWSELTRLAELVESTDAEHPFTHLLKALAEDGPGGLESLRRSPPPQYLTKLFSEGVSGRDVFIRLDADVTAADRDLYRWGFFIPEPPRSIPAYGILTIFVPVEDAELVRTEIDALATGESVRVERIEEFVVLRVNLPDNSMPPPLRRGERPNTEAFSSFIDSDANASIWVRPERARWAKVAGQLRRASWSVDPDPTFFASKLLQNTFEAIERGYALPANAHETKEWVVHLRVEGTSFDIEGTGPYTSTGTQAANAAMSPSTTKMPGVVLPDVARERIIFSSHGAVSPKAFAEWYRSLEVEETRANSQRYIERNLDDSLEEPWFWASPLQLALRGFEPLGLQDVATTVSWAMYGWRSNRGGLIGVMVFWIDAAPEQIRAASREWRRVDMKVVDGGTLAIVNHTDSGAKVAPIAEWSEVPTGQMSIVLHSLQGQRVSEREPLMGLLRGRVDVRLGESSYAFRARFRPKEADDSWSPLELKAPEEDQVPEALSDCAKAVRDVVKPFFRGAAPRSDMEMSAFNTSFEAFDGAIAACDAGDPVESNAVGRLLLLRGLHHLAVGREPAAQADMKQACELGIESACDDAVDYFSGRICPSPYYENVMVAAVPIATETVVVADMVEFECRMASRLPGAKITEDKAEVIYGERLVRPVSEGQILVEQDVLKE